MSLVSNPSSVNSVPSYSWLQDQVDRTIDSYEFTFRALALGTLDSAQRGEFFNRYVSCFECLNPAQIYEIITSNRQESILWKEVLSSSSSTKLRQLLGSLQGKFVDLFGSVPEDFEGYLKECHRVYFDQLNGAIAIFRQRISSAENAIENGNFFGDLQDTIVLHSLEVGFVNWRNSDEFQSAFWVFQKLGAMKNMQGLLHPGEMAAIEYLFDRCAPSSDLSIEILLSADPLKSFMEPFVSSANEIFKKYHQFKVNGVERLDRFKRSCFVQKYLTRTEAEAFNALCRNVLTVAPAQISEPASKKARSVKAQTQIRGVDFDYLRKRLNEFNATQAPAKHQTISFH